MKILISDYKNSMMPCHDYEMSILKKGLCNVDIEVYEYKDENRSDFLEKMKNVDALLTAFIPIDEDVFLIAKNLKVISINATGYDNINLKKATEYGVGVCPVGEYCTEDVAEHTITLMMSLNKNLKAYTYDIENNYRWKYDIVEAPERISLKTLGIFGLGKIGKKVSEIAMALGMNVIANDPYVTEEIANELNIKLVSADYIYENADIITNHMNLSNSNQQYFTEKEFLKMKKNPIFLNLGRGLSVSEMDLAKALDNGIIKAVGLDVLSGETPTLKNHILLNRDNVIITPHSAFYSKQSFYNMQKISCENIVYFLSNKKNKVFRLVNIV